METKIRKKTETTRVKDEKLKKMGVMGMLGEPGGLGVPGRLGLMQFIMHNS